MTKKMAQKLPKFLQFMEKHCQERHYSFCVKKCSDKDCKFHSVPRLEPDVFSKIHFLPDPVLDTVNTREGTHYLPFQEVYGTITTDKDQPSLKPVKTDGGHDMPFNPSAQTTARVCRTVVCQECNKPRLLHAAKKLKEKELFELDKCIEDIDFSCGSCLKDFKETQDGVLSRVFVRKDLQCSLPVEIPYYSSVLYPQICCHCACSDIIVGEAAVDVYPICVECIKIHPKIMKRKRKMFEPKVKSK
ncbi:uncharacterized protein LOC124291543 [Haliotis rubra]|uniref:uncharacterized protein LOC124291543 n=1 Tax=Haliotis rubra TaxID=36100 RepID=UPI001EE54F80|nr:uncharacterized protein LOC124291543 [Haliotis rubra]